MLILELKISRVLPYELLNDCFYVETSKCPSWGICVPNFRCGIVAHRCVVVGKCSAKNVHICKRTILTRKKPNGVTRFKVDIAFSHSGILVEILNFCQGALTVARLS